MYEWTETKAGNIITHTVDVDNYTTAGTMSIESNDGGKTWDAYFAWNAFKDHKERIDSGFNLMNDEVLERAKRSCIDWMLARPKPVVIQLVVIEQKQYNLVWHQNIQQYLVYANRYLLDTYKSSARANGLFAVVNTLQEAQNACLRKHENPEWIDQVNDLTRELSANDS